jgi:pyridoxamine 5'-phosphate oxidase
MSEVDLPAASPQADPLTLFETWLAAATKSEPNDPTAMALATVDAAGMPDCRMVLLKAVDRGGFVFYTNTLSAKGLELAANPRAALTFYWKSLRRSVRVRGTVEAVSSGEADAYFATRPRGAQIGAWASDQSREAEGALALEKRVAAVGLKYGLGAIPRPPHWSGYRVTPGSIEFWSDRPFRLHERLLFEKAAEGWRAKRLYP